MGHFAKVKDGEVVQVIVAEPEFFETFVDTSPGEWIQCSYNTKYGIHWDPETHQPSADQSKALRKNFPGTGFLYDKSKDAFYEKRPFPSWTLDEFSCIWVPPVPLPNDSKYYVWDESEQNWINPH